jgi:hypothetical protein
MPGCAAEFADSQMRHLAGGLRRFTKEINRFYERGLSRKTCPLAGYDLHFHDSQPRFQSTWSVPRQVPATSRSGLRLCSPISLPRLNPAAEAVGTVGNPPRFCFLRRVFQAMWEQWKNCLCSLIFPRLPQSGSFHSFSAGSSYLFLVPDPLPSITIATASFLILRPSQAVHALDCCQPQFYLSLNGYCFYLVSARGHSVGIGA